MNNLVRVSWGGAMTDYFTALNGVKQSTVLSPILHSVYADDRLLILSMALPRRASAVLSVYTLWAHLHTRTTSFFWHLPLLRCANFSLYVKIMPANIASSSVHLNPNVWLSYLRIVGKLSKRSMIVFLNRR